MYFPFPVFTYMCTKIGLRLRHNFIYCFWLNIITWTFFVPYRWAGPYVYVFSQLLCSGGLSEFFTFFMLALWLFSPCEVSLGFAGCLELWEGKKQSFCKYESIGPWSWGLGLLIFFLEEHVLTKCIFTFQQIQTNDRQLLVEREILAAVSDI